MIAFASPPIAALPLASLIAAVLWQLLAVPCMLVVVLGSMVCWWLFAPGPRRSRGCASAQKLLAQGRWTEALAIVESLRQPNLSEYWQGRLRNLEGESQRAAGVEAVKAGDFELGLERHLKAAELLRLNAAEVRVSVLERMLAEVRKLFAFAPGTGATAIQEMIDRVLALEPKSTQAHFWRGLALIREGNLDEAQRALVAARGDLEDKNRVEFIDPPLYLGGILLRQGKPKDALRFISEANKVEGGRPLTALHLGIAMVAAGVDGNLAARALQRALGPKGLPAWLGQPEKAWSEGLPEGRSYIRLLARDFPFACPLWGNDLRGLIRLGQLNLGQAQFHAGQHAAAAETFHKLLGESAPTHDVVRWLGVALAKLGRHDEAFKHLKAAYDLENPKDRMTAAYLAVCAAVGKPNRPEDKGPNVAWAVKTLRQYQGIGDRDWIELLTQVFHEALSLDMALPQADLEFYCDHLVSVAAHDARAAKAYHQVLVEHPQALKPEYAWLFSRAASTHAVEPPRGLELYARTFATAEGARAFFAAQGWSFEELEFGFLRQAAVREPGAFPAALGPDYATRGEALLEARSRRLEQEKQPDAALACADVWLRLAPRSPAAHDRLSQLFHARGKAERAIELLRKWSEFAPESALPWKRMAVLHARAGQPRETLDSARQALERCDIGDKAGWASFGARLTLTAALGAPEHDLQPWLEPAQELLRACLAHDARHAEGLGLLAAVLSLRGDRVGLAELSPLMQADAALPARLQFFAALSHLTAGNVTGALAAAEHARGEPKLRSEASYLAGWAHVKGQNPASATRAFEEVASDKASPSANHALAMLGALRFFGGDAAAAVARWQALPADRLAGWQLNEPLQRSLFLAGLELLQAGQYEKAAESFRAASKAGLRERAIGPLVPLALFKAGKEALLGRPNP